MDLCSLPRTPDLGEVSTGMATSPFPQPDSPSLCTRSSLPIREIPLLPLSLYCFQEGWDGVLGKGGWSPRGWVLGEGWRGLGGCPALTGNLLPRSLGSWMSSPQPPPCAASMTCELGHTGFQDIACLGSKLGEGSDSLTG